MQKYQPVAATSLVAFLFVLSLGSLYPYYRSIHLINVPPIFPITIGVAIGGTIKIIEAFPMILAPGQYARYLSLFAYGLDVAIANSSSGFPVLPIPKTGMSFQNLLLLITCVFAFTGLVNIAAPGLMNNQREQIRIGEDVARLPDNLVYSPTLVNSPPPMSTTSTWLPQSQQSWDISSLTKSMGNLLILGQSGSGKGMLLAHMLREVKRVHNARIIFIDPKADPKELGYFDGIVDVLHRGDIESMSIPDAVAFVKAGLKICADEKLNIRAAEANGQIPQRVLFVWDECVMIGSKLSIAKEKCFEDALVGLVSGGNSSGRSTWLVAQGTTLAKLGLDSTVALQFTKVIIARSEDLDRIRGWVGTTIMTGVKIDDAIEPINKSSVGRAIYSGLDSSWHPMEQLENYSGYDRDKRQYTPNTAANTRNTANTANTNTYSQHNPNTDTNSQHTSNTLNTAVLSYFQSCKVHSPKTLRDIETATSLRKFDRADIERGLSALYISGQITLVADGEWVSTDWGNLN